MNTYKNTTIAAVSTAYGEGGIGIIRISGPEASKALAEIFVMGADVEDEVFADRHMYYGHVIDPGTGDVIDEALAVFMRAPRTYTGEDVAEIHCHGSTVSLRRTLAAALSCGAEPASPGEFTQRAFLSGRIDLAQAEAVIDVIRAKTEQSARAAVSQLEGGLSDRVKEVRSQLADALAAAVVHIDYPDDDKDRNDPTSAQTLITAALRAATSGMNELIATADTGRILREGLNVVIAGAVNTGKSSLLNALLGESRAIVADMPGTTRDSIEEQASIRGIPVRLTDTAGIRDTDSAVEREGIERARAAVSNADIVIFLVDGSKPIDESDVSALRSIMGIAPDTTAAPAIIAVSKSDLAQVVTNEDITALLQSVPAPAKLYTISFSSKTGVGLEKIGDIIEDMVYTGAARQKDEPLVTNVRHKDLLIRAETETEIAARQIEDTGDIDLAETNMRAAYEYLGEITGETVTDDILERVFSRFCIGK